MNKYFILMAALAMPFLQAAEVYRGTNLSNRNKSMAEGSLRALLAKHGLGGEIVSEHTETRIWPLPETVEVLGQTVYPPMTSKDFCAVTGPDAVKFINLEMNRKEADRYYAYWTALKKVAPEVRKKEFRPLANQLCKFYNDQLKEELAREEALQQNLNFHNPIQRLSEKDLLLEVD